MIEKENIKNAYKVDVYNKYTKNDIYNKLLYTVYKIETDKYIITINDIIDAIIEIAGPSFIEMEMGGIIDPSMLSFYDGICIGDGIYYGIPKKFEHVNGYIWRGSEILGNIFETKIGGKWCSITSVKVHETRKITTIRYTYKMSDKILHRISVLRNSDYLPIQITGFLNGDIIYNSISTYTGNLETGRLITNFTDNTFETLAYHYTNLDKSSPVYADLINKFLDMINPIIILN